jgi:predicted Zn-dependent protease
VKEPISDPMRTWIGRGAVLLLSSAPFVGCAGWVGYHEIESLSEDQILFRISGNPQVRVDAVAPRIVAAATVLTRMALHHGAHAIKSELSDSGVTGDEELLARIVNNESVQGYSGALVRLGVDHMEDNHIMWQVHVIDNPLPNAFVVSSDGAPRQIFVTTGMVNLADTPDELALIIAHELAHILFNHTKHNAVEEILTFVGGVWLFKTPSFLTTAALLLSSGLYDLAVIKRRSRKHEVEADMLALRLAAIAGYDTDAASEIFRKLALYSSSSSDDIEWLSTHPPSLARYHYLKELAREENRETYGTGLQANLVTRLSNALWASTINKNQSWGERIKAKNIDTIKSKEANPSDDEGEGFYLE